MPIRRSRREESRRYKHVKGGEQPTEQEECSSAINRADTRMADFPYGGVDTQQSARLIAPLQTRQGTHRLGDSCPIVDMKGDRVETVSVTR